MNIQISIIFKKYIFVLLLLLPYSHMATARPLDTLQRYEAEKGVFSNASLQNDPTASGGRYIHFAQAGTIWWKINVPQDSYYNIHLRYRAKDGEKETLLLKNNDTIAIGLQVSGDNWHDFVQPFYLKKGSNRVGLSKSWNDVDIDYVSLDNFYPTYSIGPQQSVFYLKSPSDIRFFVNNYGKPVHALHVDGKRVAFEQIQYPYQEYASWLKVKAKDLLGLETGQHTLTTILDTVKLTSKLRVMDTEPYAGLQLFFPDVEHGNAVLIRTPEGKHILIDSGKDWVRDSIVIPLLKRQGVDTLDMFILTHYDGDHDSGDRGEKIKRLFHVKQFGDYKSFYTGQHTSFEGLDIQILNTAADGTDENSRSLSFLLTYNGFKYLHSADNYAINQEKILKRFPELGKVNVLTANHHFHGSLYPEFIVKTHPDLIVCQAQEAIYARSAYQIGVLREALPKVWTMYHENIELLPAIEYGMVVVHVNSKMDWWYETLY